MDLQITLARYARMAFAAAGLFAATLTAPAQAENIGSGPRVPAAKHWVDGYYVGYERNLYPPSAIDFSALTHIMVGRYAPRADGTLDKSCDWDASKCPAWARGIGAKAHKAGVKAILFLGGAGAYD